MTTIKVETLIQGSPEDCFDLARDVRAHTATTQSTNERVVSMPPTGLMELHDEVTFEAVHFGVRQQLTSRIVEYERPNSFTDQMVQGAFKSLRHRHSFFPANEGTRMVDEMQVEAPFGLIGRLAEILFLHSYMERFLLSRNQKLKELIEDQGQRKPISNGR